MTRRVPKPQAEPEAVTPIEKANKPMGIELSKLTGILRTVKVDYYGESLTVTFRPDELSPAKTAERARLRKEEEAGKYLSDTDIAIRDSDDLARLMSKVIVSWDMLNDGEPMAVTEDNMRVLPYALLSHIFDTMNGDMAPKARNTRRS